MTSSKSLTISELFRASASLQSPRILHDFVPAQPKKLHYLCDKCRYIVQTSKIIQNNLHKWDKEAEDAEELFQHYDTLDGIIEPALEGCYMCSFLLRCCAEKGMLQGGIGNLSYTVQLERFEY